MKAITLWQPWASLVACGAKQYETRSWATNYRGPIAIHAAVKPIRANLFGHDEYGWTYDEWLIVHDALNIGYVTTLPRGAIIATANLVECHKIGRMLGGSVLLTRDNGDGTVTERPLGGTRNEPLFGDFTPDRFAWEFENMTMLPKPIPAAGHQRLWNWTGGDGT